MTKGFTTKENILKTALDLTSKFGLESLSIGELAKSVGMSKSGLFSHFKSKEKLQIMVMDYAADSFTLKVIRPAIKKPRGIERLNSIMDHWKKWSSSYMSGGCPFLSSIVEFDDRPGNVRDHIQYLQQKMINTYEKAIIICIEEGQFKSDTDVKQTAYDIYSNMIGYHIYSRLLKDEKAYDKFTKNYQAIIKQVKI